MHKSAQAGALGPPTVECGPKANPKYANPTSGLQTQSMQTLQSSPLSSLSNSLFPTPQPPFLRQSRTLRLHFGFEISDATRHIVSRPFTPLFFIGSKLCSAWLLGFDCWVSFLLQPFFLLPCSGTWITNLCLRLNTACLLQNAFSSHYCLIGEHVYRSTRSNARKRCCSR